MSSKRKKPQNLVLQTAEHDLETPLKTPEMPQESSSKTRLQVAHAHYFLFFLMFVSLFACYLLIKPYIHPIILATILSLFVYPLYRQILYLCGSRRSLAAFITSTLLTLVVLIPLGFVVLALIQQGVQVVNAIYDWVAAGEYKTLLQHPWAQKVLALFNQYLPDIQKYFPNFNVEQIKLDKIVLQTSSAIGKNLLDQGKNLFGNLTTLAIQFVMMLFTFFFMVRDQDRMFAGILHLIPLSRSQEMQIIDRVRGVAKSVFLGTFITAALQGLSGGIAFHICGLPALFWGTIMAFCSLIPMIGTTLIWLPASLYLLLSGRWGYAIFLVCWCIVLVSSIDNIVRPIFMKGSDKNMSMLVVFFSLLGGINYFGLLGLLYGPLIIGLTMVFLYIYSLEFRDFLNQQDLR